MKAHRVELEELELGHRVTIWLCNEAEGFGPWVSGAKIFGGGIKGKPILVQADWIKRRVDTYVTLPTGSATGRRRAL